MNFAGCCRARSRPGPQRPRPTTALPSGLDPVVAAARAAAGEAVRSLGARFLELDLSGQQTEDAGGYAKEVTEETMNASRALIAKQAKQTDCLITSAAVPGRRAPILITEEAVRAMKRGSIIVDLAGPTGGNCELTVPGQVVEKNGVVIVGVENLANTVPNHASQMYANNIVQLLKLIVDKEGKLKLDVSDEIIAAMLISKDGQIVHPNVKQRLGL